MNEIRLDVCERSARDGVFEARYNGELLCRSTQPFFDSARTLLQRGYDPEARLIMVRENGTESFTAKLKVAAAYAVREGQRVGPVLTIWQPFKLTSGRTAT